MDTSFTLEFEYESLEDARAKGPWHLVNQCRTDGLRLLKPIEYEERCTPGRWGGKPYGVVIATVEETAVGMLYRAYAEYASGSGIRADLLADAQARDTQRDLELAQLNATST